MTERRVRLLWLAVIVAVGGVLGATLLLRGGGKSGASDSDLPPVLSEGIDEKVNNLLEADSEFRRNDVTVHFSKIVCVTVVFGVEPAGVASVSEVRKAYAHVYCAGGRNDLEFDQVERASFPVSVAFTPAFRVQVPADGDEYPASISKIFPRQYRKQALAGFPDPAGADGQLRARYQATFGSSG